MMIDTHCHILPGIDDGPRCLEESVSLARALTAQGVDVVIATPHQLGTFGNADAGIIRRAVQGLNDELGRLGIGLQVLPGAEVRIDINLADLIRQERIMTLADGRKYLLIELPSNTFIDMTSCVTGLADDGIIPVIAHAERLMYLAGDTATLCRWLEMGIVLQVTAAGLCGLWGGQVQKNAWELVLAGHVSVIATDAHDTELRRPVIDQAYSAVSARLGKRVADRLFTENPQHILQGQALVHAFQTAGSTGSQGQFE